MTDTLLDVLAIEPAPDQPGAPGTNGTRRFVATPPGRGFLFGGLTMALGLRAAMRTTEPALVPKSLHALFMRPGTWGDPLVLSVTTVNDSRAFAIRRVEVAQAERILAEMVVVAHCPEPGEDHQHHDAPLLPLATELSSATALLPLPGIMEVRPVAPDDVGIRSTLHPYWARFAQLPFSDPVLGCCAATFVSDYMVISTPFPGGSTRGADFVTRTLSHTVWFHRPVQSEWILLSASPLTTGEGRFTSTGAIHDERGSLVASFVQEGILRPVEGQAP
jgi:acyl-CoA thioesterase II